MFSKTCEYAIRAVIFISAETGSGQRVGVDEISKRIAAPRHFTAKILQTLSKKNLVNSQKGINGGFYLDAAQRNLPVLEIVTAIDGEKIFTDCGLGLAQCSDKNPCPLHDKFLGIRSGLRQILTDSTIDQLAGKLHDGQGVLTRT